MNLTTNFTLEELVASATAKKKKISNSPGEIEKANLLKLCETILQPVRDKLDGPIIVVSGFRSPQLNKAVGGSATSQHLKGEAADIVSKDNKRLWDLICEMILKGEIMVGQLIDEKNLSWVHVSLPDEKHHNQILHL